MYRNSNSDNHAKRAKPCQTCPWETASLEIKTTVSWWGNSDPSPSGPTATAFTRPGTVPGTTSAKTECPPQSVSWWWLYSKYVCIHIYIYILYSYYVPTSNILTRCRSLMIFASIPEDSNSSSAEVFPRESSWVTFSLQSESYTSERYWALLKGWYQYYLIPYPIGSMYAISGNMDPINIPPMLACIPYMDPMGMIP